jgi:hypothetical protein
MVVANSLKTWKLLATPRPYSQSRTGEPSPPCENAVPQRDNVVPLGNELWPKETRWCES